MPIELGEDGQDWRVWQAALPKNGSPKKDSDITSGYWRIESSKGHATPVATVFDEGMMLVRMGEADPIDRDCGEDWHRFCTNYWPKCKAAEYADHASAIETGFWPDGLPTSPRDAIGANEGPGDAVALMLQQAQEEIDKAEKLVAAGAAKTKTKSDEAAILQAALIKLKNDLDERREKEKEPHLAAGRAVDERFNPLIKKLNTIANARSGEIKVKVINPFLTAQEAIAAQAAAAAQRVLDEAEAEARKAAEEEKGEPVSEEEWAEAAPPAPTVSVPKVSVGTKGTKSSLRDVRYGKIDDAKAFAAALIDGSFSGEIMDFLQQTATRMARKNPDMKDGARLYPGVLMEVRRE